ncbi:mating-type protein MAT1-1-2 [Zalerion maritima]|uniref:Mating-type protein MAT1-1-2 n=1 Tax=Zalerion maritima TaxID=339359 RepID=A0AAD5S131_9PEZI|nr:mating-type protein MAT1-1-2 [Zalerion maritima]
MPLNPSPRVKQLSEDSVLKFNIANRLASGRCPGSFQDLKTGIPNLIDSEVLELALVIQDVRQRDFLEDRLTHIQEILSWVCYHSTPVGQQALALDLSRHVCGSYIEECMLPTISSAMYKMGHAKTIPLARKDAKHICQEIMSRVRAETIELTFARFQEILRRKGHFLTHPTELVTTQIVASILESKMLSANFQNLQGTRLTEILVYMNILDYSGHISFPDVTTLQDVDDTCHSGLGSSLLLKVNDVTLFLKGFQILSLELKQKLIDYDILAQDRITPLKKFTFCTVFPSMGAAIDNKMNFDFSQIFLLAAQLHDIFPAVLDTFMIYVARLHHISPVIRKATLENMVVPRWKTAGKKIMGILGEIQVLSKRRQHLIEDDREFGDETPWKEFRLVPSQDISIDDGVTNAAQYEVLVSTGWEVIPFRHPLHKVFGSPWSKWFANGRVNLYFHPHERTTIDIPHTVLALLDKTFQAYKNLDRAFPGVDDEKPGERQIASDAYFKYLAEATGISYGDKDISQTTSSEAVLHMDRPELAYRAHMYPSGRITFESINTILLATQRSREYSQDKRIDDGFINRTVQIPARYGLWELQA